MDPIQAVIWIFLGIFVLTALITLGGLVGWVSVKPEFQKQLFKLLILEVVGCVVGFGGQVFRTIVSPRSDLRTVLTSSVMGWDWQYAEKNWRSRIYFQQAGKGKFTMVGSTDVVDAVGHKQTVLTWESSEPFEVTTRADAVTFKARRVWTDDAAKIDPNLRYEVGKKTDVDITVHLEPALRGAIKNQASTETWGLVMTPSQ